MALETLKRIARPFVRVVRRIVGKVLVRRRTREMARAIKENPGVVKRLHVGCGNIRLPGFCNVDILPTPAVDVVSDIQRPHG
jgi:hypothetical protein